MPSKNPTMVSDTAPSTNPTVSPVKFNQQRKSVNSAGFMDSHELDAIKTELGRLCLHYLNQELEKEAFVARTRALLYISGNHSYNLSLLLKRAEVTCGEHICGFWNECSKKCQYENGSLTWDEDVAMFNKLEIKDIPRESSLDGEKPRATPDGNAHKITTLEKQLQDAHKAIGSLHGQLQSEIKERVKLGDRVDAIEQTLGALDDLYEKKSTEDVKLGMNIVAFQSIPIVDLSRPLAEIVANVGQACRQVGFMYIVNHGVKRDLMERTFELSKAFFNLPMKDKLALSNKKSKSGIRGFFCLGEENLNGKDGTRDLSKDKSSIDDKKYKGDFKEGFDCGREVQKDDPDYQCKMVDVNIWPQESTLHGFQQGVMEYQNAVLQVANTLMMAFAIGLGLPKEYFVDRCKKPMVTLRLLHYPPQEPKTMPLNDQIGCGAHTDYGCCTILNQDDVGGLQVRNSNDEWIDAPPIQDAFVINIGDMMSRWTNGSYSSTVHRVLNLSGRERYSMPLFFNPDVGTMVSTLDTCLGENETPKYPAMTSDAILTQRYEESFAHVKK